MSLFQFSILFNRILKKSQSQTNFKFNLWFNTDPALYKGAQKMTKKSLKYSEIMQQPQFCQRHYYDRQTLSQK